MNKIASFALIAGILFAACSKDKTNSNNTTTTPSYYFKFKINGTEYSGSSVNGNRAGGNNTLSVACAFNYNGVISSMALFIAGSYTGPNTYSDSTAELLIGGQTGDNYYTSPNSPVTIKITQDSNNEVKGEFSGKVYNANDSTKTLSVTDGSFYARVI